ncbi:lytic transglycosylase domain-containing protein [Roseicella aquatilis]|uniref:lytic transglycosylase domain-containing protein n=1 Tax=Roseicella aquatilis TaxID=2527868 RepID=UPI003519E3D8
MVALLLLAALAGCAARPGYVWDGRRGYDGNGDYGYDLEGSRAEARQYRARAEARVRAPSGRAYRVPGPASDPWGPHVREAAARFRVPERWIRAVMRQESGGRLYDASGGLVTSPVGAMGLMQVMPRTYDMLAAQHGLGPDPYEPRDNILAGAAYIRAMHDRFGSPGFLAAYNAGPDRTAAYLAGQTILPDETVNYVASIAPRLGSEVPSRGAFAFASGRMAEVADFGDTGAYAGGGMRGEEYSAGTAAYAGGGMRGEDYAGSTAAYAGGGLRGTDYPGGGADDPSLRAFDGGGLVTRDAPTGVLTRRVRY